MPQGLTRTGKVFKKSNTWPKAVSKILLSQSLSWLNIGRPWI